MEQNWGSKIIIIYKLSEKGRSILNEILAPYEELSVKQNKEAVHNNDTFMIIPPIAFMLTFAFFGFLS